MRPLARVLIVLFTAALILASEASAVSLSFRVGSSYFLPTDEVFRDVYGGGPAYGAEIALSLGRELEAWVSGSTFGKTGRLTFTGEETEIRLTPFLAGIRYYFTRTRLQPYIGAGAGYFFYKETSPLGTVKDQNFGLAAHAGLVVGVTRGLIVNVRAGYSTCKVKPDEFEADLGGLELGLGLGVRFGSSSNR